MHDLEIENDKVVVRGVPDKGITLASIGKKGNLYMSKVEPVLGTAHPAFSVQAPAFCAQLARIEVDPDTGEVTLHNFVVAQDVGKAINPLQIEGQMQGGAVQSLGMALTEGLIYNDKARLTNPGLLGYRKLRRPIYRTSRRSWRSPRRTARSGPAVSASPDRPGAGGDRQRIEDATECGSPTCRSSERSLWRSRPPEVLPLKAQKLAQAGSLEAEPES